MHGSEIREDALRLVAAGMNDCEVGRRLGIPRSTVRDWRRPRYLADLVTCPRCGRISRLAPTQSLRISLDARYPVIVDDTETLLRRCFPNHRVGRVVFREGGVVVVHVYCGHLACLFPQHGPGKKHACSSTSA